MTRHWIAWSWMVGAVAINAAASFLFRPAMWVTVPLAFTLVWHYSRVLRGHP